jgi:hypothetical protein
MHPWWPPSKNRFARFYAEGSPQGLKCAFANFGQFAFVASKAVDLILGTLRLVFAVPTFCFGGGDDATTEM